MQSKSVIFFFVALSTLLTSAFAQNLDYWCPDTSNLFFPNRCFIDTINTYGQKKNKEFYESRLKGDCTKNVIYSEQLIKLNEPKLFKEYYYESYRFTWFGYLGTSHNPISIRIENHNGNVFLIAKYICSNRCSKNKGLIVNDTVYIEKKEWEYFKYKIDSMNFWDISPIEKTDIVIMDGSTWILEGKNDKLYNMVHRVCGKKKDIGETCLYLIKLSNLKIKNLY